MIVFYLQKSLKKLESPKVRSYMRTAANRVPQFSDNSFRLLYTSTLWNKIERTQQIDARRLTQHCHLLGYFIKLLCSSKHTYKLWYFNLVCAYWSLLFNLRSIDDVLYISFTLIDNKQNYLQAKINHNT